jgi:hypothetical protein
VMNGYMGRGGGAVTRLAGECFYLNINMNIQVHS